MLWSEVLFAAGKSDSGYQQPFCDTWRQTCAS